MWEVKDRGFLPENDPLIITTRKDENNWDGSTSAFFVSLDQFMFAIPNLINQRRYREEVVSFLRSNPHITFENFDIECLEKLFKHYCYMASAYVHALHETTATRLPSEIALPLCMLAGELDRQPILSYSCYALNNWCRDNDDEPIVLENLELQQNFSETHKEDEDWFILIHVDIEARAAEGISAIKEYRDRYFRKDPPKLIEHCDPEIYVDFLKRMHASLRMINITMSRMPENCSEDFYFKAVRPFIFGFDKVKYEGTKSFGFGKLVEDVHSLNQQSRFPHNEVTLRGETGAQSSIIPAYVAALHVEHTDSVLTTHLKDMRKYMPKEHREFLVDVEMLNVSGQAGTIREVSLREEKCVELYNTCLEELLNFRTKHLEFAIDYIQKQVDDPMGTGGTPFIPWLTQLRDETEDRYIK